MNSTQTDPGCLRDTWSTAPWRLNVHHHQNFQVVIYLPWYILMTWILGSNLGREPQPSQTHTQPILCLNHMLVSMLNEQRRDQMSYTHTPRDAFASRPYGFVSLRSPLLPEHVLREKCGEFSVHTRDMIWNGMRSREGEWRSFIRSSNINALVRDSDRSFQPCAAPP